VTVYNVVVHFGSYAPTVDPNLSVDQRNFRTKYLQNGEEN